MDETERRDPITNVPVERAELDVYLAGTPTLSGIEFLERCLSMLRR
ncbi:hypothetical protein [Natronococcus occultus]|uniref:Uncharacterized protein n=1 Tax=Natronococcus occultus SP4 TaxID=694430 RepID=L0K3P7_9EURY|nr:hypothetical protein [Natronococcus occultus]AGB38728.1 hypothetical protein Natoc_2973 [Natronococcus occultus SP4]